jgi:hypothetical protein
LHLPTEQRTQTQQDEHGEGERIQRSDSKAKTAGNARQQR